MHKNNFKNVVVKPASRNVNKGLKYCYGARKSWETQLLATMFNTKISHKVTKVGLCRQGSKVTKGCSSETYLSVTAIISKQECLLICYRFNNIVSV